MNIRNVALEDVIGILEEKKPLHTVLLSSLNGIEDKREKAFVARLVRGCVERAYSIDRIIDDVSSVPLKKQKKVIRNILRIGTYQILFMDSVTDFAACDESVKLAGKRGFKALQGFINGVLRNICRRKEDFKGLYVPEKESGDSLIDKGSMAFKYSVPQWIVDGFCSAYGEEKAEAAFRYFLNENGISFRVNTSNISLEQFEGIIGDDIRKASKAENPEKYGISSRENSSIRVEKSRYIDKCYKIYGAGSIEELRIFEDGLVTAQDMSSALVGYLCESIMSRINVTGNIGVLDICAAPGGKSLYLADLNANVTACDISETKLSLIRENAERCHFSNIELRLNDATAYNDEFEGKFDIVLCDLPCSGLGIIGKKPDIKYNMTPEKIVELAELQKRMLKNASRYLKTGGYLVYSTCTLTKQENTENVEFIKRELDLAGVMIEEFLPLGIKAEHSEDNYIQILPGEYGSDGFFISLFKRELK